MNHLVNTVQSQLDGEYLHTDMFNKKLGLASLDQCVTRNLNMHDERGRS